MFRSPSISALPDWLLELPNLAWLAFGGNPPSDRLEQLAQAHGWRIDRLWEAPLREDQGRPVMGWYVHLQPALT